MIQKTIFIGIISLIIVFSLLSGCAPTSLAIKQKTIPEQDTLVTEEKPEPEETVIDTVTTLDIIDSLIQQANSFCAQADYPQVHAILSEAIYLIVNENGLTEEEWTDSNDFLYQIAELYTTALPKEYLDSIPADITGIIFQYQMAIAIDTLSLFPDDSVILSIFECEEGIPYNIPIVHNERVQNALYYIVTKRSRTMGKLLTRANYYLSFMQRLFAENNMPTDLTYLPILESGFNPKAYSYAHASGIWQFIPSTGRIFGLRKNYWIDERRDPIKSTNAAIGYLKKLFSDFNDWYLALAAYNCGERNIERAIKKAETTDYWQLTLPNQTMHYVPQFIAYQIVGKNPQCFGFQVEQSDTFNLDTVYVSDCLDLNKVADGLNISYTDLKKINPHIRQWCTPPNMKDVVLYLPYGIADTFKVFLESLSEDDKVRWYRYRIRSGDNLGSISRRFRISVPAIRSINKLRGNFIIAGRYLYIPIPVSGSYPRSTGKIPKGNYKVRTKQRKKPPEARVFSKKGLEPIKYQLSSRETIADVSKLFNVKIQAICRWNKISNPRRVRAGTIITLYVEEPNIKKKPPQIKKTQVPNVPKSVYTVKNGDNLYAIARKLGISTENLANWNNKDLKNPIIQPGEQLTYYSNAQSSERQVTKDTKNSDILLYKVQKGDNISNLADLFSIDINRILLLNNLKSNSIIKPGDIIRIPSTGRNKKIKKIDKNYKQSPRRVIYYKVQKGDNLWSIANLFGISVNTLYKANNLKKDSVLMPGDTIRIVLPEGS